jgi:hypothetical protein
MALSSSRDQDAVAVGDHGGGDEKDLVFFVQGPSILADLHRTVRPTESKAGLDRIMALH